MPNILIVTCAKSYITRIIVSPIKSHVNGLKKHKNLCRNFLTNTRSPVHLYVEKQMEFWLSIEIITYIFVKLKSNRNLFDLILIFPRGLDSYCWQRNDNKWDPIQKFSHCLSGERERDPYLSLILLLVPLPLFSFFSSSYLPSISFPFLSWKEQYFTSKTSIYGTCCEWREHLNIWTWFDPELFPLQSLGGSTKKCATMLYIWYIHVHCPVRKVSLEPGDLTLITHHHFIDIPPYRFNSDLRKKLLSCLFSAIVCICYSHKKKILRPCTIFQR